MRRPIDFSMTPYSPIKRPVPVEKNYTVQIVSYGYPIVLILGYLVGWAIGGSIG